MGEPAEPTEAERAERVKLALAIVEAVRNDEKDPLSPTESEMALNPALALQRWHERIDFALFGLAQEVCMLRDELQCIRPVYHAAHALRNTWVDEPKDNLRAALATAVDAASDAL